MIDGEKLAKPETRLQAIHRTQLLLQRIAQFLSPTVPKIFIVLTRRDLAPPAEGNVAAVKDQAARLGISVEILSIASFSEGNGVVPGAGLAELLIRTVDTCSEPGDFWPNANRATGGRQALKFRGPV
jgi:hypothetical protein